MRKQDYLVGLISTLGPNEKRYFKLFSALQPGEKRYLRLFDALEGKKKYEAASLCSELNVEPAQLADDKYYLTQTLLQSLRNYDHESTELAILRNSKENVQALINRRMFHFALDLVDKNLARAWELEVFELIHSLLLMRGACRQNLGIYVIDDDLPAQHKLCTNKLAEVVDLMHLRGQARHLEIMAAAGEEFEYILNHPLIKGGTMGLKSLRAKSLRFETLSHFYSSIVDDSALLALAREERDLYLKHPVIKIINPIVYFTNWSRLIMGETDFELRRKLVANMQKELQDPEIKISNQRRDGLIWGSNLTNLWNLRYLYRFKEALPLAEKTYNQGVGRSEYERLSVGFEYALILLHNRAAARANEVIDELLRYKSDVRLNMQPFIRLLHIMAQLDMRNYLVIPSAIKSARFWIKGKESSNEELSLFLKHAGLIAKAPVAKRPAWLALMRDIEAGKLPTINRQLQLDAWVTSLLKDRNI